LLPPYGARSEDLPTALGNLLGERSYNSPNVYASGAPDPVALRAKVIARQWQGGFYQVFGPSDPGELFVSLNVYAGEEGARQAFRENDFPNSTQTISAPIALGDEAKGGRGIGANTGSLGMTWRRGRLVFDVSQRFDPGQETLDRIIDLARKLDARYAADPLR